MPGHVNKPHLPEGEVGLAVIGARYAPKLGKAMRGLGIDVLWMPDAPAADPRLAGHADLSVIHLGGDRIVSACGGEFDSELAALGFEVITVPGPGGKYPQDCGLNACIAGGRLFHRLDITAREVLERIDGLKPVKIAQGYAKCCTCVVDERSIITSDHGIAAAARGEGLDVLEITPGYIELDGFGYGFIGGAAFKLSRGAMAFTGRMDGHPDWGGIRVFLSERGITPEILTGYAAFDVGSVLPLTERRRAGTACP